MADWFYGEYKRKGKAVEKSENKITLSLMTAGSLNMTAGSSFVDICRKLTEVNFLWRTTFCLRVFQAQ